MEFENIDPKKLKCISYFEDENTGKHILEMNWFALTDDPNIYYKSMTPIIEKIYNNYKEGLYEARN